MIDKLDIATVDVGPKPQAVKLQLDIEWAGFVYRIMITDDNNSTKLYCLNTTAELRSLDAGDALIGYALRRAICRGIDKSEVVETTADGLTTVTINLGKMPGS